MTYNAFWIRPQLGKTFAPFVLMKNSSVMLNLNQVMAITKLERGPYAKQYHICTQCFNPWYTCLCHSMLYCCLLLINIPWKAKPIPDLITITKVITQ